MNELAIDYRDQHIKVHVDSTTVSLVINGIERQAATADSATTVLRLSSTVQTDYEWHEFIEALVSFDDGGAHVRVSASDVVVAESHLPTT